SARTGLERGLGRPLSEEERRKRHERLFGKLTDEPIIPIFKRVTPLIDVLKTRTPYLVHKKLIGVFGILDPESVLELRR
ncbi:unnamed protein product, partial [marine sediment metagenome]